MLASQDTDSKLLYALVPSVLVKARSVKTTVSSLRCPGPITCCIVHPLHKGAAPDNKHFKE